VDKRDIHIEVPVLRMELAGIKYQVMTMLETRHGEMQMAIQSGITMAYQQLPAMVAERVRAGILEAAAEATSTALQEYFGPGGPGYRRIMEDVIAQIEGKEVGRQVDPAFYVIGGEDAERNIDRDQLPRYDSLGKALEQKGRLTGNTYIWAVMEGKPWKAIYGWGKSEPDGIWSWGRIL
jgi:hypothetical protein